MLEKLLLQIFGLSSAMLDNETILKHCSYPDIDLLLSIKLSAKNMQEFIIGQDTFRDDHRIGLVQRLDSMNRSISTLKKSYVAEGRKIVLFEDLELKIKRSKELLAI